MVSHWPISSKHTLNITKEMFSYLKRNPNSSFNKALYEAQKTFQKNPKTSHPFYWAPYSIFGNF